MQHPYSAEDAFAQTDPAMGQYGPTQAPPPSGNGAGVAGFVLALLSPCTCGLLAPIALLLSLIGLRKPPRGLAIAGTIISLFFTIGCGGFWALVGINLANDISKVGWENWESYFDLDSIDTAAWSKSTADQAPPADISQVPVTPGSLFDPAGVPYVYVVLPSGMGYSIHGAGQDGVFNTTDDINFIRPDATTFMSDYEFWQGSADLPPELIPEGY